MRIQKAKQDSASKEDTLITEEPGSENTTLIQGNMTPVTDRKDYLNH